MRALRIAKSEMSGSRGFTTDLYRLVQIVLPQVECSTFQGKRPLDPEYVSNEALRAMCENVLQLLCNTVENMDVVSPFSARFRF